MRDIRGFTLIEVIVAIALLGLLAVAFITSIGNYVNWMESARNNITQASFATQGELEINIYELKDALSKGNDLEVGGKYKFGITKKIENIKLFESEFNDINRQYPDIYQVETSFNENVNYVTWVGDERLSELPVPVIETKSLIFQKNSIDSNEKFEYSNFLNLRLKGTSKMISNPSNSRYKHRYDWYVSKPGYNIPLFDIDSVNWEYDFGRLYPRFPDDYISLPIVSELDNTDIDINGFLDNSFVKLYPGRQIIFTVTPFGKSLKKGDTSVSNPIYIYGPKYTTNLDIHLDASTIDLDDRYNSSSNINGSIQNGDYKIRRWKNNRPNTSSPNINLSAVQTTVSRMPYITRTLIEGLELTYALPFQGEAGNESVWGRALGNMDNTMSTMKISNINMGNNFSIFVVLRKVDIPLAPQLNTIIRGNAQNGNKLWSLDWVGETENPRLSLITGSNRAELTSTLNLGEWYLIQATAQSTDLNLKVISLNNINNNLNANGIKSLTSNTRTIDIDWNGVDIAEILVYNGNISEFDLADIESYLISKYNPNF